MNLTSFTIRMIGWIALGLVSFASFPGNFFMGFLVAVPLNVAWNIFCDNVLPHFGISDRKTIHPSNLRGILFDRYEVVNGMQPCRKKPIIVHAKQIMEPFQVNTMEGNYKQGKAGDYLMTGIDGEHYICDKEIFEKTYDWVKE